MFNFRLGYYISTLTYKTVEVTLGDNDVSGGYAKGSVNNAGYYDGDLNISCTVSGGPPRDTGDNIVEGGSDNVTFFNIADGYTQHTVVFGNMGRANQSSSFWGLNTGPYYGVPPNKVTVTVSIGSTWRYTGVGNQKETIRYQDFVQTFTMPTYNNPEDPDDIPYWVPY